MKLKKLFSSAAMAAALIGFGSPAQSAIMTDIVFMVDESGSMGTIQANLRNNIGLFASILSAGGVDAQYGLVGFGNTQAVPRMLSDLTDDTSLAAAANNLVSSGSVESGYSATAFALNAIDNQIDLFSYRPNAVKNIIIFTDEDNDFRSTAGFTVNGLAPSYAVIDGLLTQNNALFNAVVSDGGACLTANDDCYVPLALAHNGQQFDLDALNTNDQQVVEDFVTAFANAKLQETIDFCDENPNAPGCTDNGENPTVSEPSILALFGLGLLGLQLVRRRA
ncbi:MAG: vWA domain-containing protein [Gammaproteobacteria bacterium]